MTTSSAFLQQVQASVSLPNNIGLKTVLINDSFPTVGAVGNGWRDLAGGIYSVTGAGQLTASTTDGAGFTSKFLLRPIVENTLNQEVTVDLSAGLVTQATIGAVLRHQAGTNNHYMTKLNPAGSLEVFKIIGGGVNNVIFGTDFSVTGFVYNNAHKYTLQFSCYGQGSTTLKIKVFNNTTGDTVLDMTAVDTETSLQSAGSSGISVWSNGNNNAIVNRISTSKFNTGTNFINTIFYGDSITKGEGSSNSGFFNTLNGYVYPGYVARNMGEAFTGYNLGVGGRRVDQMITQAVTDFPTSFVTGFQNVLVVLGGANDIIQSNGTVSEIHDRLKTLCKYAKTVNSNCKVVICTILPASQISAGRFNYNRNQINSLIRANYRDYADVLCDLATDSNMGFDGAEFNTQYYSGDNIHPSNGGYKVVGDLVAKSIKLAINNGGGVLDGNPVKIVLNPKTDVLKTIPVNASDYIDIGTWTSSNGGHSLLVTITGETTYFGFAKTYNIVCAYGDTADIWQVAKHATGKVMDNGNNVELLVKSSTTAMSLRLRKAPGSTSSAVGNIRVSMTNIGTPIDAFVEATTTGNDTTVYEQFGQMINPNALSKLLTITTGTGTISAPYTSFTALVNKTVGSVTNFALPSPTANPEFEAGGYIAVIKDVKGDASINPITIYQNGGGQIESFTTPGVFATTSVINQNFGSVTLYYTGISGKEWIINEDRSFDTLKNEIYMTNLINQ